MKALFLEVPSSGHLHNRVQQEIRVDHVKRMIELENNDVGVEEDNTEKHDVFEAEPVTGGFLVAKDESE